MATTRRPGAGLIGSALLALMVFAASCGDSETEDARAQDAVTTTAHDDAGIADSLTNDVRPDDLDAEAALRELNLLDTPGLPPTVVRALRADQESDPIYEVTDDHYAAGHEHDTAAAQAAMDALTQDQLAELDAQLARAEEAARRYPTVAEARAAGYLPIGPPAPNLGVHFVNMKIQAQADFHLDHPGVLMYEGLAPDDRVVGILYLTRNLHPPKAFVGEVDQWHEHLQVCIAHESGADEITIVGVDDTTLSKESCDEAGGVLFGESGWMVHVWPIEGLVPSEGPFAESNPLVQVG